MTQTQEPLPETARDQLAAERADKLLKWAEDDGKPMSLGGRIVGVVIAAALLGLAYWMFTNYTLFDSGAVQSSSGRVRSRFWLTVIGWLWSRPVAVVAAVLGLLVLAGAVLGGRGKPHSAA